MLSHLNCITSSRATYSSIGQPKPVIGFCVESSHHAQESLMHAAARVDAVCRTGRAVRTLAQAAHVTAPSPSARISSSRGCSCSGRHQAELQSVYPGRGACIARRSPSSRYQGTKQGLQALPSKKTAPAQPAVQWGVSRKLQPGGAGTGDVDPQDEEDTNWAFLDLSRLSYRWPVPWGPGVMVGGMALWIVSFVAVGFVAVPLAYRSAGISIFDLNSQDRAIFTLVCQIAETAVSLALIRLLTVKALDEAPEDTQAAFFNYSPAQPFKGPKGWAVWAGIGVLLSPFVVGTVAGLLSLVGYEESVGGKGTVDGVASMINMDLPSYLSLLSVTGLMAPVLEETVFRGFLLTSLTKFVPTWVAIPTSAFFFGLAHLSPRDFPVLFALGCLLGALYVRSGNLLTPIVVHGAWNSTVLTLLFYLASTGVDIEELVQQMNGSP